MRNFHIKSGHLPTKGRFRRAGYADNKGYTIGDTQAEALAWAGLQGTVAWDTLSRTVKSTIINAISDHKSNAEKNCEL